MEKMKQGRDILNKRGGEKRKESKETGVKKVYQSKFSTNFIQKPQIWLATNQNRERKKSQTISERI